MLKKGDSTNHPLKVEKVEVECFQMKYDHANGKLTLESLVKAER
jgi:hypothetical protein